MANILVTGGAGYIGSTTSHSLIEAGYNVTVYDNLSTGFKEAIPKQATFCMGDILDTDKIKECIRANSISAIVHFAAKLIVPESLDKPCEYYENNVMGIISILKACRDTKISKVIFSSTAAVYGNQVGAGLLNEASPTSPLNPYGHSKLMSEQILHDADLAYEIKSVCLRYFNVAGASPDGKNGQRTKNATHLVKVASEAACGKRGSVAVFGADYPTPDGTGVRDYIHVEDLASLHVLALQYLERGGKSEILNCGYGHGYSVYQVLDTMKKVSGSDFKIEVNPRRPGDAASLVANVDKLKSIFGWTPQYDNLDLICKSAFDWEKKKIYV